MSSSPNRRSSNASITNNDTDVASDRSISGQPKKLRKQINNDEFKQNYFELSLNNNSVQLLAFQQGADKNSTPKKRKRSSASSRRKSVVDEERSDSNTDSPDLSSPKLVESQQKKRKPSVSTEEIILEDGSPLFDHDELFQSLRDNELFETLLRKNSVDQTVIDEDDCLESLFCQPKKQSVKSALKAMKKPNIACSTTNVQTTSSVSFDLKRNQQSNTTETNTPPQYNPHTQPNQHNPAVALSNISYASLTRRHSNSHPIILNQSNENTIRKRSNSCLSSNSTTGSGACKLSPPERLMSKELPLNFYLTNIRREATSNNSVDSQQESPNTASSLSSLIQPMKALSTCTVSTANDSFLYDGHNDSSSAQPVQWSEMQYQISPLNNFSFPNNNTLRGAVGMTTNQENTLVNDHSQAHLSQYITETDCKHYVNSFFDQQSINNQTNVCPNSNGGLDNNLFDFLYQTIPSNLQQNTATDSIQPLCNSINSQSAVQPLGNSPCIGPEQQGLADSSQVNLDRLIQYLIRINESNKANRVAQPMTTDVQQVGAFSAMADEEDHSEPSYDFQNTMDEFLF